MIGLPTVSYGASRRRLAGSCYISDGNPSFINQYLSTLTDAGLIAFDSAPSRCSWDVRRIHAEGYIDKVADLMNGKPVRLPAATQHALQQLACLGNTATTSRRLNRLTRY
jgi:predicted ATPase